MVNINVFSASAGSGKTYTLARQVIDLLVADPRSYAHILAVTFTNKATGEMKDRIVGDLDIMANGDDGDPAREALLQTHLAMCHDRGWAQATRGQVIARSKDALRNILLDYGQFSVSTIDRFVQRVIRSFAYEQGLPSNYGLQLDADPIIEGAVDNLMESLANDKALCDLVLDMTERAIDEDKSWGKAETDIKELGKILLGEGAAVDVETLTTENINLLRKEMEARQEDATKHVLRLFSQIRKLYSDCAISNIDGSQKKFINFLAEEMPSPDFETYEGKHQVLKYVDEKVKYLLIDLTVENIPKKGTKGQVDEFLDGLRGIIAQIPDAMAPSRTAEAVLNKISVLGVMGRLARFIGDVAERNNKINMSGSGKLLSDLIDSCPTPFIYEKIGVRYDTIMIDEFQDTSRTQYGNFRPLLAESLAEGHDCLIVGDVKQSIYRFRGGDWQLLGRQVGQDFERDFRLIPLTDNYRSKAQIVNFNNAIFSVLPRVMDSTLYSAGLKSADGTTNLLEAMYADAHQNVKKGDNGFARLTIVSALKDDADAAKQYVEDAYVGALKEALDCGYSFSDICILVRKAKDAQDVIARLSREEWQGRPIPVMSDDSLYVMSSDATVCIADVMRYISSGEKVFLFSALKTLRGLTVEKLGETFNDVKNLGEELNKLRGLGILELVGSIVNMLPRELRNADALYIDAFRQQVMDAVKDGESELGTFLRRVEDNKDSWTVWATSSRPAVNLMTVHKSKGLEFKVVIIPKADWELEPSAGKETIWCPAERLKIDTWQDGSLPLTFNSKLANSDFAQDYVAEREQVFADNLNMAYVAFTRPKEVLYAFGFNQVAKEKKAKKVSQIESSSQIVKYLAATLADMESNGGPVTSRSITVDDDGHESDGALHQLTITDYADGQLHPQQATADAEPSVAQMNVEMPLFSDPVARFKINAEAESRIIDDAADADAPSRALMISTGLTNHGILENVMTLADLHSAIRHAVTNGTLAEAEAHERETEMRRRIEADPVVSEWFDGDKVKKVWTETSMVGPSGGASAMPFVRRRPDRVMRMADGRTVLVDYKFGKRSPKHHAQVREYVKWLNCAGFERVEAYLWYYGEGCVERIAL